MTIKRNIIIIGAGAAGIGFGVALKELGLSSYLILEKDQIGQSFRNWPLETRFITPSFTSNGFGLPDLNAVSPDTSPAYTFGQERLSGADYADYLKLITETYHLPVRENQTVLRITQVGKYYHVQTPTTTYQATYLIFALGEFQFPQRPEIIGAELAVHYGEIKTWSAVANSRGTIIGGNESAIDAAINLASLGKSVTIYTNTSSLTENIADPSRSLSPYTRQRYLDALANQALIKIISGKQLTKLTRTGANYQLLFIDQTTVTVPDPPILCTGFQNGLQSLASHLFDFQEQVAQLSNVDESLQAKNCFQIGPYVRHQDAIFCYIYKFRQRFAVIISEIARRQGLEINQEKLVGYRKNAMYLDDFRTCQVDCPC